MTTKSVAIYILPIQHLNLIGGNVAKIQKFKSHTRDTREYQEHCNNWMVLHNENTKPTSSTSSSSLASSRVFSELQSAPWTSLMIKNQPTPIFIKSRFTDSCYYIIFTGMYLSTINPPLIHHSSTTHPPLIHHSCEVLSFIRFVACMV